MRLVKHLFAKSVNYLQKYLTAKNASGNHCVIYGVNLCKNGPEKFPYLDTFQAVNYFFLCI